MSVHLTDPGAVLMRLEEIERDLHARQNVLESAALLWFKAKRQKEKDWAAAFMLAEGSVAERKAQADLATAQVGMLEEAEWEATRAVVRTLETRASIGQSILRSQARS